MKIIFFTPHPFEDPSSRLRVYQYLEEFERKNIEFDIWSFTNEKLFKTLMMRTPISISTIVKSLFCYIKRLISIIPASKYDIAFIHRELSPFWERIPNILLKKLAKKVIYDFDDAVFTIPTQVKKSHLKFRGKGSSEFWCKNADAVIAGNKYLENYAAKFSAKTYLIPTAIDTERYSSIASVKKSKDKDDKITLGWIGTPDNFFYIKIIEDVLERLQVKYGFTFIVIGNSRGELKGCEIEKFDWSYEKELEYLSLFDIGIYPIRDDEYARGKSGYKAIQYMASGIPCIASRIEANLDIIEDGDNGFLASNPVEWEKKLQMLILKPELREKFRINGLKTVNEKYSKKDTMEKLYKIFEEIHMLG